MKRIIPVLVVAALAALGCTKETSSSSSAPGENTLAVEKPAEGAALVQAQPIGELTATAKKEGGEESCAGEAGGEGCCGGMDKVAPAELPEVPADARWVVLKVQNMKCGGCAAKIRAQLDGLDGVLAVDANHESGEVKIALAKNAATDRGALVERLTDIGYPPAE